MPNNMEFEMLATFEAGSIQQYVFESGRLRDIRGASGLLDWVNRVLIPEELAKLNGVEEIRSAGGVSLAGFRKKDEKIIKELENSIQRLFARHVPGVALYTGRIICIEKKPADNLMALSYRTSHNQGNQPLIDSSSSIISPLIQFCKSCGLRPVEQEHKISDEYELICEVCHAKRKYGERIRDGELKAGPLGRFIQWKGKDGCWDSYNNPKAWEAIIPEDFDNIGAHADGEIAMILADGNRLGQLLAAFTTFDGFRQFSRLLAEYVEEAVFEVLQKYGPRRNDTGKMCLPWEIILLGGDDVLIVTAANIALQVATEIMHGVESKTKKLFTGGELAGITRKHIDMGVGVAIAPAHFPMRALHALTQELEKSAKKKAYALQKDQVSTIDFHRVTGDGNTELSRARREDLKPRRFLRSKKQKIERDETEHPWVACLRDQDVQNIQLICRPFTKDECLEVLEVARKWRRAGLPNSKVHALYDSLLENPAEAMFAWAKIVGRANKKETPVWQMLERLMERRHDKRDFEMPWINEKYASTSMKSMQSVRKTYLLDVIDMWSLLREEQISEG